MNDYMMALSERFGIKSPAEDELRECLGKACQELRKVLAPENEKLLLRLLDRETALQDEMTLYAFLSGYRLAEGIHAELNRHPPYSFIAEEEERGRQVFEKERSEKDGKNEESLRADS